MITKLTVLIVTLLSCGCSFIRDATTYRAAEYQPGPCDHLDDSSRYQCLSYQEQVRQNRVNTFNQIYNSFQQPVRQRTTTNCTPDHFGGMNCTSY